MISYSDFEKVEIHTGTILSAVPLPKARKPAYLLEIDFGPLGQKKSSAQITDLYTPDDLIGKQILAVTNFEPKQIGKIMSECLVLGVYANENKNVVLATTSQATSNGLRVF